MRWAPPLPPRSASTKLATAQAAMPSEADVIADTQTITESA
jgi:hypothetical protein